MTGQDCPACGAKRGERGERGEDGRPGCACAERAARIPHAERSAEAAAAEDFDPLRIRPYVTLPNAPGGDPGAFAGMARARAGPPHAKAARRALARGWAARGWAARVGTRMAPARVRPARVGTRTASART